MMLWGLTQYCKPPSFSLIDHGLTSQNLKTLNKTTHQEKIVHTAKLDPQNFK